MGSIICALVIGAGVAVMNIHELRTTENTNELASMSLGALIRDLLRNKPFVQYLAIKMLISISYHLYNAIGVYYFKYVWFHENAVGTMAMLNRLALISAAMYWSTCAR